MWSNQADKFTWCDDLGAFPERRKVLAIAGDQKVCMHCIGALNKDVVVRTASRAGFVIGRRNVVRWTRPAG
jgi:hypothetical protein